jgi:hypothetical protein
VGTVSVEAIKRLGREERGRGRILGKEGSGTHAAEPGGGLREVPGEGGEDGAGRDARAKDPKSVGERRLATSSSSGPRAPLSTSYPSSAPLPSL